MDTEGVNRENCLEKPLPLKILVWKGHQFSGPKIYISTQLKRFPKVIGNIFCGGKMLSFKAGYTLKPVLRDTAMRNQDRNSLGPKTYISIIR